MNELDYVSVPVPKHLVPQVYELISAHMVNKGKGLPALPGAPTGEIGPLPDEVLKRIWDESAAAMRKVLKHLAQQP
ncbi:MAG: hypothetical protein ACRENE_35540, partial [Polyangiaceae bacterium]